MSTKVSLTRCVDELSGTKAHLYEECLAPDTHPVYLELSGVKELSVDIDEQGGSRVNVAIPRDLALQLGLLPPKKQPNSET